MGGLTLERSVDVQIEAVLALIFQQQLFDVHEVFAPRLGHHFQSFRFVGQVGREPLRTSRAVPVGHAGRCPLLRIARRTEAVDADGRRCVRDAQEDFDRTQWIGHGQDEALNEAILCLDTGAGRSFSNGEGCGQGQQSLDEEDDQERDANGPIHCHGGKTAANCAASRYTEVLILTVITRYHHICYLDPIYTC